MTVAFAATAVLFWVPSAPPPTEGVADPRNTALTVVVGMAALSSGWALWWAHRTAARLALPMARLAQTDVELSAPRPSGLTELDDLTEAMVALRSHLGAQTERLREADVQLGRARHAVERANRARATFLSNMSHELRTPLAAMVGTADALSSASLDTAAQQTALEGIRDSGANLLALVQTLLEFSRIESGQLTVDPVPTPLRALLEGLAEETEPRATARGLALRTDLSAGADVAVVVDADRLRTALRPLLDNAVKFTPNGTVVLRERSERTPDGLQVVISVADTGVGIAPEHHTAIFEPFDQIDNSASRDFGGMGLGLALAQRIAVLLGGVLMVESRPGAGSCFSLALLLPLVVGPLRQGTSRGRVGLQGFAPRREEELRESLTRLGYSPGPPSDQDDIRLFAWREDMRAELEALRPLLPGVTLCALDVPPLVDAESCGACEALGGDAGIPELAVLLRSRAEREVSAGSAPAARPPLPG